MKNITTKAQAKTLVSALRREFKTLPGMTELPSHTACLDLVAKAIGFKKWNDWEATLSDVEIQSVATKGSSPEWSPAHGPMTEAQYAEGEGLCCPVCGDRHALEGSSWDADAGYATQEMYCSACDSSWTDDYTLNGFTLETHGRNSFQPELAKEKGFLYALRLWILNDADELREDDQYNLDELVVDAALEAAMQSVNDAATSTAQGTAIGDAEARGSEINNEGLIGQLAFLLEARGDRESMISLLEASFKLDRTKLIL